MKKGMGIIAGAMALAGLGASAQVTQSLAAKTSSEIQATEAAATKRNTSKLGINPMTGGLDNFTGGQFGMTPKEYGQVFGHGNKKGRSNMNRYAHNAKLKRRMAA